ncbi:hypothetical protein L228DRAFT_51883 [Xylona heveae TC161]|uniref:Uncharacterized protein n=1 Tax=Xylona heveae (strain CBS 132557 / TC161) TaxID=1328760 RepID=A0A164ZE67_XYLHT|nr:hypothetical protein L228DRAFT_51883 [Xylona heveae TC161]KZF18989.1 hypothetical protein L228DRAFT_51883 [Xylona heveae TC161]
MARGEFVDLFLSFLSSLFSLALLFLSFLSTTFGQLWLPFYSVQLHLWFIVIKVWEC